MNKRNFFKSLALLAGAASISPQIFLPKPGAVTWKRLPIKQIAVINPEWVSAEYQISFIDYSGKWDFVTGPIEVSKHVHKRDGVNFTGNPFPETRFRLENGVFVHVPPYKLINDPAT